MSDPSPGTAHPDGLAAVQGVVRLPLLPNPHGAAEVEADNFQLDVDRLCQLLEDDR